MRLSQVSELARISLSASIQAEDAADVPSLIHQSVGKLYSQYKKKRRAFLAQIILSCSYSSWLALRYIITQESLGGEP